MADIKVKFPYPSNTDPTAYVLMKMQDNGDGTHSPVISASGLSASSVGGAPDTADYLVGTAQAGLSAEIVVGTAPGGELGGTWGSPTVDATHSGSSHAGIISAHEGSADPHTGYRLESADHTHQSAGAQAGTLDHGLALTGLTDDDHTQYVKTTDGGLAKAYAIGNATATQAIDVANGNIQTVTLTTATVITLAAVTTARGGSAAGSSVEIWVTQDSVGGRALTWPAGVNWIGGTPSPSTAASSVSIYVLTSLDGYTTARGVLVGGNAGLDGQVVTSDGTNPAYEYPPGFQIDYAEITAAVNITSTAETTADVIISGATVAFDGTPVVVSVDIVGVLTSVAGTQAFLWLYEDGVSIGRLGAVFQPTGGGILRTPVFLQRRHTPSAGDHAYSVRGHLNANAFQVLAGVGGLGAYFPSFLRITKA